MYFPFLRGKQFELEALLELPPHVYQNTLPIVEPVNIPNRPFYSRLAGQNIPFILITNPFHPQGNTVPLSNVQALIDGPLNSHSALCLGFIVDVRFQTGDLISFLNANSTRNKVLIFRNNPLRVDLTAIQALVSSHSIQSLIFDNSKTSNSTRQMFTAHPNRVLLIDGFQRQDRNVDYPLVSTFDSIFDSWDRDGWAGLGDYVTIGDYYQDGGGPVRVVSLHITTNTPTGLEVNHFSSTTNATIQGLSAQKFAEANRLLVTSPAIIPLSSAGLNIFRSLNSSGHNPQLGVAKKASIMHHIELMSSII